MDAKSLPTKKKHIDAAPFVVNIDEEVLADIKRRLTLTRWPIAPAAEPWRYGARLAYMRDVADYWRDSYDWRKSERAINQFPNYRASVGGLDIHFIMEEGSGPSPKPLILTHGWPGSIVEFLGVIAPLAHPERFGGDVADAFTVIVPSLPGYGFSQPPPAPITPRDIAAIWNRLMTENLGFERYFAQGGDWGAYVTSWLGYDFPQSVGAIHLNMIALRANDNLPLDDEEKAWFANTKAHFAPQAGYWTVQSTRPQTLAYGLTDSPVGLAAWILEKFHGWTVPGENRPPPFDRDHLLANIMLYWLAGPNAASWLYVSLQDKKSTRLPAGEKVQVPTGVLLCPRDVTPPPDQWVRRMYNLVHRTDAAKGGHFVALEQGELFVADVQNFFRAYR